MNLRTHLENLSLPRNPTAHPDSHRLAREYITSCLEGYGRTVETQEFASGLADFAGASAAGLNILAGPDRPRHLLVAHYDTVDHSPGADDNGSAVAVALEIARACPDVAVLFPDLEETGLLGARHFVASDRWNGVPALVLESVGYWTDRPGSQRYPEILPVAFPGPYEQLRKRDFRGDFWALLHLDSEGERARALSQCLDQDVLALAVPEALLESAQAEPLRDFGRSDHLAFWEHGRPCLMLTDSANFRNPHYHQPSDTADTLNFEQMELLAAGLIRYFTTHPG